MPRYKIIDPDSGECFVETRDEEAAAELYAEREWNGDSFESARFGIIEPHTGKRWSVSCTVEMQPSFAFSMMTLPEQKPRKIRATKLKASSTR